MGLFDSIRRVVGDGTAKSDDTATQSDLVDTRDLDSLVRFDDAIDADYDEAPPPRTSPRPTPPTPSALAAVSARCSSGCTAASGATRRLPMPSSSTAFMTPVGYQTNLLMYGPGGCRFTDYLKVGTPLQAIFAVVTTLGIAYFWGLASA